METVYYHLDARRVSLCDMASGEAAPVRRSYAVLRRAEEKRPGEGGKVLDLAAYRRKMTAEEEDAVCPPVRLPDSTPAPFRAAAAGRVRRARHAGLALDFAATLAILVMATVVVAGFLPFL